MKEMDLSQQGFVSLQELIKKRNPDEIASPGTITETISFHQMENSGIGEKIIPQF